MGSLRSLGTASPAPLYPNFTPITNNYRENGRVKQLAVTVRAPVHRGVVSISKQKGVATRPVEHAADTHGSAFQDVEDQVLINNEKPIPLGLEPGISRPRARHGEASQPGDAVEYFRRELFGLERAINGDVVEYPFKVPQGEGTV